MTTSGSYDFTQNRNQIISDALVTLGVYRPGATISTNDYNVCSNWLNKIAKAWDRKGIHMWTQVEGTLFLRVGVNTYTLSSSSTDQAGDNCIETTLSSDSSGTSLTVTSTTGMTALDHVGIVLDDGTLQWTTIVSVDSSTGLTITASLNSSATSGNNVFTFTSQSTFPVSVSSCRFRESSGTDRPVKMLGRDEFMNIPTKTAEGKINQACYVCDGTDSGRMYVWPTPDSTSDRLRYSYTRRIQDFDQSTDNADLPEEWLEPLTLNLMAKVSGIYGKDTQERQLLAQDAAISLQEMQLFDLDSGSVRLVPNSRDDE